MPYDSDSSNEDIKFPYSPKTYTISKSQSLKIKNSSIENEAVVQKHINNSLLSKILPKQKYSSMAKLNNFSPDVDKAEGSSESSLNNKSNSSNEWNKNFVGNSYPSSQSSPTAAAVTSKNICSNQYARTRKNLQTIVKNEPNKQTVHQITKAISPDKTSLSGNITSAKALQSPPGNTSKVISNSMMDIIKKWTINPTLNVQNDQNQSLCKSDSNDCFDKAPTQNAKATKRKRSSPIFKQNGQIDVYNSPPCKKVKQSRNSKPEDFIKATNAKKISQNSNNLSSKKSNSRSTKTIKSEVPYSPPSKKCRQSRNTKTQDSPIKKKHTKTAKNNLSLKSTKKSTPAKSTKNISPDSSKNNKSKSAKNSVSLTDKAKRQLSNCFEIKSPLVILQDVNGEHKVTQEMNSSKTCTSNRSKNTESEGMPNGNHCDINAENESLLNQKEGRNFPSGDLKVMKDQNKSLNAHIMQIQSTPMPYKKSNPKKIFCENNDFSSEFSSAVEVQNTSLNTVISQIRGPTINYEKSNQCHSNAHALQSYVAGNNNANLASLIQPFSNTVNAVPAVVNNNAHALQPYLAGNNNANLASLMQPFSNTANAVVPAVVNNALSTNNFSHSVVPAVFNNALSSNNLSHSVASNLPLTIMALQPFNSTDGINKLANFVFMKCNMPVNECMEIAKKSYGEHNVEVISITDKSISQTISTYRRSYRVSEVDIRHHAIGLTTDLCYSNTLHQVHERLQGMSLEQCKKEIKDHFTSSRLRVKQYYGDQDIQRSYRNYFTPYANSENPQLHTEFKLNDDFENTPVYEVLKKYINFHLQVLLKLYNGNHSCPRRDILLPKNSKLTYIERFLLTEIYPTEEKVNLKDLASSLTFLGLKVLFNEFKRREFQKGEV